MRWVASYNRAGILWSASTIAILACEPSKCSTKCHQKRFHVARPPLTSRSEEGKAVLQEDMAYCISNTKRRRRASPGPAMKDGKDHTRDRDRDY